MRRRFVLALAAWTAAVCGLVTAGPAAAGSVAGPPVAAREAAAVPAWGRARQLPGLDTIDTGKSVQPMALSCARAGECALGGSYTDSAGRTQAFVAAERGGVWGPATEVGGTAALNRGGAAVVTSVSCPAPGDCAAAGRYSPGGTVAGRAEPRSEAFTVTERGGRWGTAEPLPGLAARNSGGSAGAAALSCWAPGDCTVAGTYASAVRGRDLITGAFVAGQRGGRWGQAVPLPGLAALNTGGQAEVSALSCAPGGERAAGNCAVGGEYGARLGTGAYAAREVNGAWRAAAVLPGTAVRGGGGAARVTSLSCPSAASCAAAGSYTYDTGHGTQAATGFVTDLRAGRWSAPRKIGGTGDVISCGSPGNCAAGGTNGAGAFVVTETGGHWGGSRPVPGLAGLDTGRDAGIMAVSCAPSGTCGAGGSYAAPRSSDHAFVVTSAGGTWSRAHPALAAPGDSAVTLMSCVSPLTCTAAGYDHSGSGIFVLSTAPR